MRALTYSPPPRSTLARRDRARSAVPRAQRRADLLIPVVKAWCTDLGVEIASLGIQVHGGMGYIEETGAAQYFRDARIAPIYEGTNGIQANDLVGRKLGRDRGEAARELFAEIRATMADLAERAAWAPLIAASPKGSTRWSGRQPISSRPSRRSRRRARRPIWRCSAPSPAAG